MGIFLQIEKDEKFTRVKAKLNKRRNENEKTS